MDYTACFDFFTTTEWLSSSRTCKNWFAATASNRSRQLRIFKILLKHQSREATFAQVYGIKPIATAGLSPFSLVHLVTRFELTEPSVLTIDQLHGCITSLPSIRVIQVPIKCAKMKEQLWNESTAAMTQPRAQLRELRLSFKSMHHDPSLDFVITRFLSLLMSSSSCRDFLTHLHLEYLPLSVYLPSIMQLKVLSSFHLSKYGSTRDYGDSRDPFVKALSQRIFPQMRIIAHCQTLTQLSIGIDEGTNDFTNQLIQVLAEEKIVLPQIQQFPTLEQCQLAPGILQCLHAVMPNLTILAPLSYTLTDLTALQLFYRLESLTLGTIDGMTPQKRDSFVLDQLCACGRSTTSSATPAVASTLTHLVLPLWRWHDNQHWERIRAALPQLTQIDAVENVPAPPPPPLPSAKPM